MSGLDIFYSGKQLIKEEFSKPSTFGYGKQGDGSKTISFSTNYRYKFKATYEVRRVVKNSVAAKAGLKAGDIVLAINRKLVYNYDLSTIINKLQERENKRIRITIKRKGEKMTFSFRLEKKI